jgi:hypothetical protein
MHDGLSHMFMHHMSCRMLYPYCRWLDTCIHIAVDYDRWLQCFVASWGDDIGGVWYHMHICVVYRRISYWHESCCCMWMMIVDDKCVWWIHTCDIWNWLVDELCHNWICDLMNLCISEICWMLWSMWIGVYVQLWTLLMVVNN